MNMEAVLWVKTTHEIVTNYDLMTVFYLPINKNTDIKLEALDSHGVCRNIKLTLKE